ncbi:MAG: alanine racemase [Lachnospiraceae bacterium]|nr:alanine racemase [Lachnospiraceae bacterium]
MLKRSYVEIDLDILRQNYRILKETLHDGQEIMCVVKADAYGHGAVPAAKVYSSEGCRNFAVSNIEEALELRKAGIEGQILILGYTPASFAGELKTHHITQALLSYEHAAAFSGSGIEAQFAIDTGMNRIGLDADDPEECEAIIRKFSKEVHLTGLFTHLCSADTPDNEENTAFTMEQIRKFKAVSERVRDLELPYIHCLNSAGGLFHNCYGNLVRFGIVLYGLKPDISNTLPEGLRPAMTWKSVISMIKPVRKGETIGYGRTFRADRDLMAATIPTGYADGYSRRLSNCGKVLIHGKEAPIIGRICMDQFMADVTDIPEAAFEDEVILLGATYNADDMAEDLGTIGYEVVCDIGKRVRRVYKGEEKR